MPELPLLPHQLLAINKFTNPNQPGLVLQHSTGRGKGRTAIEAVKKLNQPTTIIVPASLKENIRKEWRNWVGGELPPNVKLVSQQEVARKGIEQFDNPTLIVDEAGHMHSIDSKLLASLKKSKSTKRLLLTATPAANAAYEYAPLINFAANEKVLPEKPQEFNKRYVDEKPDNLSIYQKFMGLKAGTTPQLKNKKELQQILNKYVDYSKGTTEGYPSVKEESIKVPMGSNQTDIYNTILRDAPWWVRTKVRLSLNPQKSELDKMRAFLVGARQISNTNKEFIRGSRYEAPKINEAFKFFQKNLRNDPTYKAIVYSNYINSGLKPYEQLLNKAKIPYGEFSGQVDDVTRNEMVKQYNINKLKALLISSAGAEGLDTKGTRLVQLLEPHFNSQKEKQIIGRAVRYKSHEKLPKEKQNVLVQRYMAEPRSGWWDRLMGRPTTKGTDEYIRNIALRKDELNKQVEALLQKESAENPFDSLSEAVGNISDTFKQTITPKQTLTSNLPKITDVLPIVYDNVVQPQIKNYASQIPILDKIENNPNGSIFGKFLSGLYTKNYNNSNAYNYIKDNPDIKAVKAIVDHIDNDNKRGYLNSLARLDMQNMAMPYNKFKTTQQILNSSGLANEFVKDQLNNNKKKFVKQIQHTTTSPVATGITLNLIGKHINKLRPLTNVGRGLTGVGLVTNAAIETNRAIESGGFKNYLDEENKKQTLFKNIPAYLNTVLNNSQSPIATLINTGRNIKDIITNAEFPIQGAPVRRLRG